MNNVDAEKLITLATTNLRHSRKMMDDFEAALTILAAARRAADAGEDVAAVLAVLEPDDVEHTRAKLVEMRKAAAVQERTLRTFKP